MQEVAAAGEDHGDFGGIAGGDAIGVFFGTTGLDNVPDAEGGGGFDVVGEGEKGVGNQDGFGEDGGGIEAKAGNVFTGFFDGEFAHGVDAVRLAGAHAEDGVATGSGLPCQQDCIGFEVLADADAEVGRGAQGIGNSGFCDEVPGFRRVQVGLLGEGAAVDGTGKAAGEGGGQGVVEGDKTDVLRFGLEKFEGVGLKGGGDESLDEAAFEDLRSGEVHGAGDGDDGTKGGDHVAFPSGGERGGEGFTGGGAAGVGVFNDDSGGGGKQFAGGFEGGIAIDIVVIGHFLAVEDAGGGESRLGGEGGIRAERGGLVRIFAIAQRNFGRGSVGEPSGDGGIVGGGARKHFLGEGAAALDGQVAAGAEGGEGGGIVRGIGQYDHIRVIFGGRAEHGGAADIDVFDGGAFLKGVEIDADEVDGAQTHLGAGFHVGRVGAPLEDASVDFGMERFDAAIENFGVAGEGGYVDDGNARIA